MSKVSMFLSSLSVAALTIGLAGCANEQAPSAQPAADQPEAESQSDHAGQMNQMSMDHEHMDMGQAKETESGTANDEGAGKYEKALAELSEADRALAEKQKVCPVSGEPLGVMGKPYKVTVKGQEVFLCCPSCESEIKANPDKYLAKLNK